jgi:hypothetical protein
MYRAGSKESWKLRALERILENAPQPHPRQGTVLEVRVRGLADGGCPYCTYSRNKSSKNEKYCRHFSTISTRFNFFLLCIYDVFVGAPRNKAIDRYEVT